MANSSPSSSISSGRRNKTGCMGSIAHLFDFNQALAGRKLLTDKKYGPGLDSFKNSSNDGTTEKAKLSSSSRGEILNGKSQSISRRINEVPIKSLIAEEISKESDSKKRSPSVVARLMGLEGLPNDSKNKPKLQNSGGSETFLQKRPSEQITHNKIDTHHSQENVKRAASLLSRSMSDLSSSKRSIGEGYISSLKSYPYVSHSNGNGFVEELETWKLWQSENCAKTNALDNLESQLNAKQMLIKKKLTEAKLGISQRRKDLEEEFFDIKEYSDARETNKDFFRKSHEQPDSLFARNLQKNSGNSNADHHQQGPTRIVVLKPSIGRVRDMSTSQNSPRSPNEFLEAMEIIRENSMDVLQDLRERLQQEDFRDKGVGQDSSKNSQPHKMLKDPKEIAREIARQVRENVTRDMMANNGSLLTYNRSRSTLDRSVEQDYVSSGRDHRNKRVSRHNSTIDMRSKEEIESRTLDYLKVVDSESSSIRVTGLRKPAIENSYLGSFGQQPYDSSSSSRHSVDATYLKHCHRSIPTIDLDSSSYSLSESEAESEEQTNDDMYRMMLRSRSVPTGSFSLYSDEEDYSESSIDNDHMTKKMVANRPLDATISRAEPLRRSIFGGKGVEIRNNFSRSKNRKGSEMIDEIAVVHESNRYNPVEIGKNQCQIDDTGPILDSDSTSSLDNFLSLEAALMEEDMLRREACIQKDCGMDSSATECSISEKLTITDAEDRQETIEDSEASMHSPSVSPRRTINSMTSDGMIGNTLKFRKDVFEQPSPVSVLDVAFHEESPSSVDFSDISSGLRDLRSRLQLLKFIDNETSSSLEVSQDDDSHFTDDDKFVELSGQDEEIESLNLLIDCMHCPKGRELELVYVRDLLLASGFMGDNATMLTRWHSPKQPLAFNLFEKMEDNYTNDVSKDQILSYHTRHLLFDRVNEALVEVLGLEFNGPKWWKYPCTSRVAVPSGKILLQQVWAGVWKIYRSLSDGQDTLGNLVAHDLSGKDRWCDLDIEFELIMLEVERAIFNDLMLDAVMLF